MPFCFSEKKECIMATFVFSENYARGEKWHHFCDNSPGIDGLVCA